MQYLACIEIGCVAFCSKRAIALAYDQATSHYLKQLCLVYWRIYASLSLNELMVFLMYQLWGQTAKDSQGTSNITHNISGGLPIYKSISVCCFLMYQLWGQTAKDSQGTSNITHNISGGLLIYKSISVCCLGCLYGFDFTQNIYDTKPSLVPTEKKIHHRLMGKCLVLDNALIWNDQQRKSGNRNVIMLTVNISTSMRGTIFTKLIQ